MKKYILVSIDDRDKLYKNDRILISKYVKRKSEFDDVSNIEYDFDINIKYNKKYGNLFITNNNDTKVYVPCIDVEDIISSIKTYMDRYIDLDS